MISQNLYLFFFSLLYIYLVKNIHSAKLILRSKDLNSTKDPVRQNVNWKFYFIKT